MTFVWFAKMLIAGRGLIRTVCSVPLILGFSAHHFVVMRCLTMDLCKLP